MTLEHYLGMIEKALMRIAEQAAKHWNLQGVRVIHRVGKLRPGGPIVMVLTASAHRHDAYHGHSQDRGPVLEE